MGEFMSKKIDFTNILIYIIKISDFNNILT